MGAYTTASGQDSTAMGISTVASGLASMAMGNSTVASGYWSMTMGVSTVASGKGSVALGRSTTAASYNEVAMGQYNVGGGTGTSWVTTDPLFEIGNGSSSSALNDALIVLKNGNVGIGTTSPAAPLTVQSTSAQMQLNYDSSHNVPFSVSSGGNLTITPTGGTVQINGGTFNQVFEVANTYNGLDEIMYVQNSQAAAAGVGSTVDFAGTAGNNVQARIAGAWNGAANTDAYLSFYTRGSGNPNEQMRITSTGSVGIGTTSPGAAGGERDDAA
jgi:Head domain of trimeric autotransporter adhesin